MEIEPQTTKEDFSRKQHLEDLSDDLDPAHAIKPATNGVGGGGRIHRGSTSSAGAKSNGSEPLIEEDEEEDLELVALANGTADAAGDASAAGSRSAAVAAAAHHGRLLRKVKRANRANSISEEGRFGGGSAGLAICYTFYGGKIKVSYVASCVFSSLVASTGKILYTY